jgi:hypothetical protein
METINLKVTRAELDAICLALHEASEYRLEMDYNLKANKQVANVYDSLRKAIRVLHPHNASMEVLIKQLGSKR